MTLTDLCCLVYSEREDAISVVFGWTEGWIVMLLCDCEILAGRSGKVQFKMIIFSYSLSLTEEGIYVKKKVTFFFLESSH